MRKEELLKKIQDSSTHKVDILVPSKNMKYSFKPLTVLHFSKITKLLLENSTELNREIGNIFNELSDGEITVKNCNNIDKVAILLALKNGGDYSKVISINHKCENCGEKNVLNFDLASINTKYSIDIDSSYEADLEGLNFKFSLAFPTLNELIEYDRIKFVQKEKESDKQAFELYSNLYESNMLFIKEIYCNGEIIEDFTNISIKDRLMFLNRLNNSLININSIIDFILNRSQAIATDYICKKCETSNNNITIKLDNFLN